MSALRTVLVANRGEIAVRVVRACRDHGLRSVAVFTAEDRDALHVELADDAVELTGETTAATHLSTESLLRAAQTSGADAVHPGYGFLSEDADFAQAVVEAGLTWIGPPPEAIRALGDKVGARRIAREVGAPLVPGTDGPVADAAEVLAFADAHGLPVAIKAAHGGGGRGMKVARTRAEIPELFTSAVREARAAFGRGECFVERYVDRPRHVEAQVLADAHGTVLVVGTRDCSLQRRYQKLVEEAPAPFLTDDQRRTVHEASRDICRAAGYRSAGTVEFLLGEDGLLTFLEVNTRLQVEHPVSEETSGLDLVREQFRVAAGLPLSTTTDPVPRGHSIEFRVNGEDAGRGFLPSPGTVTALRLPSGPGVRVDAGVEAGTVVTGRFDSLLAKLVVTGADRAQALDRARRALREFRVGGLATVLPFHRAVVDDPDFTASAASGFRVHTRWIETEWAGGVPPYAGPVDEDPPSTVTVGGRELSVRLPAGLQLADRGPRTNAATSEDGRVTAPMQGSVTRVAVADGAVVRTGDVVLVVEAMKMEHPVLAPRDGTVAGLTAAVGDSLAYRAVVCTIT